MANTEWVNVEGFNSADDTEVGIYTRQNSDGNTEVAYYASCVVTVVEVSGELHFTNDGELAESTAHEDHDMHECYVAVEDGKGGAAVLAFNDQSEVDVLGGGMEVSVVSSACFDPADPYDEEHNNYDDLMDVMGLAFN